MSLQVWLPLNGDLHNQGLSNQTNNITSTPNWHTPGKISSTSLYTNTQQTTMHFPGLEGVSTYSVAYWLYVPSDATITDWADMFGIYFVCNDGTTSVERDEVRNADYPGQHAYHLAKSANEGSNTYTYYGLGNRNHSSNTWAHYVLTKDNNYAKLYINGTLINSYAANLFENAPRVMNGNVYLGMSGCEAYLNDFRIYDHVLSLKEIEELSKGLILHYKLDDPYVESTTNLLVSPYSTSLVFIEFDKPWDSSKHSNAIRPATGWSDGYNSGVSEPTTGYHAMWNIIENIPTIVFQNHNSEINKQGRWLGISTSISTLISANTIYTLSWEQKSIDSLGGYTTGGLYYKLTSSSSQAFNDGCPKIGQNTKLNTWEKFSYTFTRNASYDGNTSTNTLYIYGYYGVESTMYVRNVQLEIKNHATPYVIDSRQNPVVYDSSGYSYNGTIIGNLTAAANTARYQTATYISSGDTNYIQTPTIGLPGDKITLNFWFKSSNQAPGSNYHMPLAAAANSNQAYEMSIYKTGYLRGGLVVAGTRKVDNCTSTKLLDNNWHMCTMTYDGTIIKRYVDAIMEKSTTTTGTLITSTYFVLGHYGTNTSYCSKETYISDVRIYATALTDSQVKELYDTSMSIDSNGNIHARELIEENSANISNIKHPIFQ